MMTLLPTTKLAFDVKNMPIVHPLLLLLLLLSLFLSGHIPSASAANSTYGKLLKTP